MKGVLDSTIQPMKVHPRRFVSFILALAAFALNLSVIQSASAWYFTNTGSLNIPREFHTATLLSNGKVLVAGGRNNLVLLSSTELYDPATGAWSNTGSLVTARLEHTATLLTNGR